MTGSALSTASRYPLLTAAPALARFHPEAGGDARRGLQSSDTDQLLFTKSSSPAVPAPLEIAFGPFSLRPTQFLLLKGATSRCASGAVLWKSWWRCLNVQVSWSAKRN